MGLTENLLTAGQVWITGLLFVVLLAYTLLTVRWSTFSQDTVLQHTFYGAAVVLGFLWQLRAGLSPGLSIHIFGITVLTLMMGWRLASLAGLLALVITVVTGREPWQMFAVNGLITVFIPALISHAIMRWEYRKGFRSFFAYIFFCGFFGAGIAVAGAGIAMCLLLWTAGVYSWAELIHEYVRYLPLFMIPEGFANGAFTTGLVVFHPDRLVTFDQRRYR